MICRDAVETDLAEIVAIYNASIPSRMATADLEPVSFESRQAWFHQHSPSDRPIWVMEVDRAIAGWLSFQSFYGRPAYHATAEISGVIYPQWRNSTVLSEIFISWVSKFVKKNRREKYKTSFYELSAIAVY